jgi:hypothetical protein
MVVSAGLATRIGKGAISRLRELALGLYAEDRSVEAVGKGEQLIWLLVMPLDSWWYAR